MSEKFTINTDVILTINTKNKVYFPFIFHYIIGSLVSHVLFHTCIDVWSYTILLSHYRKEFLSIKLITQVNDYTAIYYTTSILPGALILRISFS